MYTYGLEKRSTVLFQSPSSCSISHSYPTLGPHVGSDDRPLEGVRVCSEACDDGCGSYASADGYSFPDSLRENLAYPNATHTIGELDLHSF